MYVMNNPVNRIDRFGLDVVVIDGRTYDDGRVESTPAWQAALEVAGAVTGYKWLKVLPGLIKMYKNQKPCDVKYHYTDAPESLFRNGLRQDSSVTDNPNLSPAEAVDKLGLKRPPDKIIPIQDNGNFVENRPFIVEPHYHGEGGGHDFTNPNRIPSQDILPAIPLKK